MISFPPVSREFLADFTNPICIMTGPVGAGKSYTCAQKMMLMAECKEAVRGVRHTKWIVFRSNYNELEQSILRDLEFEVFPKGTFVKRGQSPIKFRVEYRMPDDTQVLIEGIADAYEDEATAKRKLRSTLYTNAICLEMQTLKYPGIITEVFSRCDRFPAGKDGGIRWELPDGTFAEGGRLFGDMNYVNQGHWFHKYCTDDNKPGLDGTRPRTLYAIPPAFEPVEDEEGDYFYNGMRHAFTPNEEFQMYADLVHGRRTDSGAIIRNSGFRYYYGLLKQFQGDDSRIMTDLLAQWGFAVDGRPVHRKFLHTVHVGQPIYDPHLPVHVGVDNGFNNAWVFGQVDHGGRLNILSEVVNVGDEAKHIEDAIIEDVIPHVANNYSRSPIIYWTDVAMNNRDGGRGEKQISIMRQHRMDARLVTEVYFQQDRANQLDWFLTRRGAIKISERCTWVVEALAGGLHYKLDKEGQYRKEWQKNKHSHPGEAAQYLCSAIRQMLTEGFERGRTPTVSHSGFRF